MNDESKPEVDEVALLRELVGSIQLMQVATVHGGAPWLVHVWFAADDDLQLFFLSNRSRRHSEELRADPRVAGGLVRLDEFEGPGQTVRGVCFEGSADEVGGGDLAHAYASYADRWPQLSSMIPLSAMQDGSSPSTLYRIRPKTFVLFDELNFPTSPRRVISEW